MDSVEGKVCSKCGVWKPADEYHKSAKKGLQSRCKVCRCRRTKPKKENVKRYPKYTGRGQGAHRIPIIEVESDAGTVPGRVCSVCKVPKQLDAFWKSNKQYGGYTTICKECINARRRAQYAEKPKKPAPVREILPERACRTCGEIKPLEAFYADARSYDNRTKDCRECYNTNLMKGLGIHEFEAEQGHSNS